MALILNPDQVQLRDSAAAFLAAKAPVSQGRQLRDQRDATGFDRAVWRGFAEMGYSGILVPEQHGGLGLGHVEVGVVMEQVGRHLSVSPWLASAIVAAVALRQAGSAAQQAQWLPRLAASQAIATLAVDEGAKHRPMHLGATLRADANGWVLDGDKSVVLQAHTADLFIVAARSSGNAGDSHGIALCLVERGAPGLEVERTLMVDSQNAGRIRLRRVAVTAAQMLGAVDEGAAALSAALNAGRCAAAAELLGLGDEVFARTVDYLKQRRQFGRLIGEFQALQHRAALVYCEQELTRAAVMQAQQSLDRDMHQAGADVAVAKARAGRSATLAVQEAVQMHGGMGMTDAFEIGFFMKRARVLQELWGDAHFHQDQAARQRGY